MHNIGTLLREYRCRKGLTLKALSDLSGISVGNLSAIESGLRRPSVERVCLLTELETVPRNEWVPLYVGCEERPSTLCRLATELLRLDDLRWAEQVLRKARSLNRNHYGGRYSTQIADLYGRIAYHQGRYRRACGWFRQVEKGAHHRLDPVERAKSLYNFAQALARSNRVFEAGLRFDEAADVFRRHHRHLELGRTLLAKANLLMLQVGCYQETRSLYAKAAHLLRGNPLYLDASLGRIIANWYSTSPTNAYDELSRLLPLATARVHLAKIHHNLGVALRQLGRPKEAIPHLNEALNHHTEVESPAHAATLTELCLCHVLTGEQGKGREALNRAASMPGMKDAQDAAALAVLAVVLGNSLSVEIPSGITDDYERRLQAALVLLQAAT